MSTTQSADSGLHPAYRQLVGVDRSSGDGNQETQTLTV